MSRSKVRLLHGPLYFVKDYELLEHTADIGIRVRAETPEQLFTKAAAAMFDVVAEKAPPANKATGSQVIQIKILGQSREELFVNWLNELLSLSATKELIFSDFKINKLDGKSLEANAYGTSAFNYKMNTEIKAATYHQLKIEQLKDGWQAEVIFDV